MKSDSKDSKKSSKIYIFLTIIFVIGILLYINDYNISTIFDYFNKKSTLIGGEKLSDISTINIPDNVENLIDTMLNKF